jgi:hypothetical protein
MVTFFCESSLFSQNFGISGYFGVQHAIGYSSLGNSSALNPASISNQSENFVVLRTKPARFGISELSPISIVTGYNIDSNWAIGANLMGIGGKLYSEITSEIRIANRITKLVTLGISGEFSRLSIQNYGNKNLAFVNFGATVNISDDLTAGFLLRNLLRNYSESSDKTVYQQAITGFSYQIDDDIIIELDADIVINAASSFCLGIKYLPHEVIAIRSAFRTAPNQLEIAAMTNIVSDIFMIIGFDYNEVLGASPEIAL